MVQMQNSGDTMTDRSTKLKKRIFLNLDGEFFRITEAEL